MTSVKGSLPPSLDVTVTSASSALSSICVPSVVTSYHSSGQMSLSRPAPPPPPPTSSSSSSSSHHHHHQVPAASLASLAGRSLPHSHLHSHLHSHTSPGPLHLPLAPPPPPPPSAAAAFSRTRLPILAHPHPVMLFEGPPGSIIPLPLPPPPYSTLPSRCNQRRFFDQVINFNSNLLHSSQHTPPAASAAAAAAASASNSSSSNNSSHNNNSNVNANATSTPTGSCNNASQSNNNSLLTPSCLPSYHHLYSSVSPASLRRQQRRMRREHRSVNDPGESSLTENKKYLIFVSLLVIGILLMFIGIVTLSLFTISFGFTFILFALLLYKLLPSSKYAPRIIDTTRRSPITLTASSVRGHHHAYMITPNADCVTVTGYPVSLPPPPPSYQEALTSGQIIQPLDVTHLLPGDSSNDHDNHSPVQISTNNLSHNGSSNQLSSTHISTNNNSSHQRNIFNHNNLDSSNFHGFSPGEVTVVTARTDSVTVTSTCSPAKSAAIVKVECNDNTFNSDCNRNSTNSNSHVLPIINCNSLTTNTSGTDSLTTTSTSTSSSSNNLNNQALSTICIGNSSNRQCNNNNSSLLITDAARDASSSTSSSSSSSSPSDDISNSNNRLHFITIIEATI